MAESLADALEKAFMWGGETISVKKMKRLVEAIRSGDEEEKRCATNDIVPVPVPVTQDIAVPDVPPESTRPPSVFPYGDEALALDLLPTGWKTALNHYLNRGDVDNAPPCDLAEFKPIGRGPIVDVHLYKLYRLSDTNIAGFSEEPGCYSIRWAGTHSMFYAVRFGTLAHACAIACRIVGRPIASGDNLAEILSAAMEVTQESRTPENSSRWMSEDAAMPYIRPTPYLSRGGYYLTQDRRFLARVIGESRLALLPYVVALFDAAYPLSPPTMCLYDPVGASCSISAMPPLTYDVSTSNISSRVPLWSTQTDAGTTVLGRPTYFEVGDIVMTRVSDSPMVIEDMSLPEITLRPYEGVRWVTTISQQVRQPENGHPPMPSDIVIMIKQNHEPVPPALSSCEFMYMRPDTTFLH